MDREMLAAEAWAMAPDDVRRVDARGAAWVRGVRLESAPPAVLAQLARGKVPTTPAKAPKVARAAAPTAPKAARLPSREARRRAARQAARAIRRAAREKRAAKRAAAANAAPAPVALATVLEMPRPRRTCSRLPRAAYREADATRPQVDDERQALFDHTWRGIWPSKGRATLLEAFGEWCEAHESDVAEALCTFGERAARRLIRDVDREYERREREAMQAEPWADAAE